MDTHAHTTRRAALAAERSVASRHGARMRPFLLSAALAAACAVVGVGAAGGTYALLNDTVTAPGATLQAGTMDLKINGKSSETLPSVTLAGNRSDSVAFTLTNVGSTDVTLDAAATVGPDQPALAGYIHVTLVPLAQGQTCAAPASPAWVPLATFSVSDVDTLAPGASKDYCLSRWLSNSTPVARAGESVDFTLTLTTKQKP